MVCEHCEGVGYICEVCDQPDGECTCKDSDDTTIVRCPECGGQGEIP
jgi:hypothetical protein